jgi:Mg-chelatase subunit ChlD
VTKEPEAPVPPEPPPPPRGLVPTFFGLPLASKDVVLVLDVSGSVGSTGLEAVKAELVGAVERLASDVRVAALFFDETVHAWHPETTPATPAAKEDLARFVRGLARGKRTDVMTPLNAGLQIVRRRVEARIAAKEPAGERATMVVVSDGQENVRATPGEHVGDKLDRLDLAHAVVHAVVLGGRDSPLLAALARRGGGTYRVVP